MAEEENASTARNPEHSPLLGLPAEVRNMIYHYAIGNNIIAIIDYTCLRDSMQRAAVLLQVCRQLYHETLPLVLGINMLSGYGKRMAKVLRRLADSSHAGYIKNICIWLEVNSITIDSSKKNGEGGGVHLCRNLVSLVEVLRGLQALERVVIRCPGEWGADTNDAFKMKMERELHADRLARRIKVETRVEFEGWMLAVESGMG
ncbi:hypothetical protein M3J09_002526 [Ascochyta lentis]